MQDSATKYPTTTTSTTLPCYLVNNLAKNTQEQCKFIVDNDCLEDEATFDYVYFVFCGLSYETRYLAVALIVFLVLVLFLNLSAVADEFLCPSLLTIAKSLRMSDSLAGVTLLAFGNGCPDIFSSLAAASSGRPELIVGELMGAGVFCSSIVAGLIFINHDFKLARRPLLRDASFYLLAVYLVWFYCYNGSITFYGSLAFIVIYVIYLLIALSGQALHARLRGEYPIASSSCSSSSSPDGAHPQQHEKSWRGELGLFDDNEINENWFRWREESTRRRSSVKMEQLQLQKIQKTSYNAVSGQQQLQVPWAGCELGTADGDSPETTVTTIELPLAVGGLMSHGDQQASTMRSLQDSIGGHKLDYQRLQIRVAQGQCQFDDKPPVAAAAIKEQQIRGRQAELEQEERSSNKSSATETRIDSNRASSSSSSNSNKFTLDEFDDFLFRVNPINTIVWSEAGLWTRAVSVLRAPLLLVTILTIPVVDQERLHNNWCRLLNSIHCFTVPGAVLVLTKLNPSSWLSSASASASASSSSSLSTSARDGSGLHTVDQFGISSDTLQNEEFVPHAKLLLLLPGLLLGLYVFNTSSAKRAPSYHSLFAYFGFVMSVMWIYVLANEIISLLKTVGIIFSMSDTAIGLGVLAWGNSLGDIVANLTLAQAGHARMALGASIGAPLLNLLLGFGLAFTVSLRAGEAVAIEYNTTMSLLAGSLASILLLLMASTVFATKRSKRPFGYCLIGCYGVYFVLAVCLECELF